MSSQAVGLRGGSSFALETIATVTLVGRRGSENAFNLADAALDHAGGIQEGMGRTEAGSDRPKNRNCH